MTMPQSWNLQQFIKKTFILPSEYTYSQWKLTVEKIRGGIEEERYFKYLWHNFLKPLTWRWGLYGLSNVEFFGKAGGGWLSQTVRKGMSEPRVCGHQGSLQGPAGLNQATQWEGRRSRPVPALKVCSSTSRGSSDYREQDLTLES